LIRRSGGITVIVVDAEADETLATPAPVTPVSAPASTGNLLSPQRIVIWNDPVSKETIFRQLVDAILPGTGLSADGILAKLNEREKTGSTFLNEGVALPHARIEGLKEAQIALGLTHAGILDSPTALPNEVVFMLLSPTQGATVHLQLLAKAARLLQSRELRKRLAKAQTPEEALDSIRTFEQTATAATEPAAVKSDSA
jgi:PTS system nitrogen regulatory IIA component